MRLTTEKREEQTQDNAEDDTGNDRKIKSGVTALDSDIARQTSEPACADSAPKREPQKEQENAEDHQYFSDFGHAGKHRVRRRRRQPTLAGSLDQSHSRMMKLGQLSEAALYASDLDAAQEFYRDVLGLEGISRMENRGLSFRCGATVLLVFDPARTRIPDGDVPTHGATGEGHIAFVINETEIEPWRARLTAAGIAMESEVEWPSGGRSLYFRDPAGNVVELAPPMLWRAEL